MEILIAAIVFVGLSVFIMCFNIIFRHKPFPDSEIGHSRELRKRGIICAREEEMKLWGPKHGKGASCDGTSCSDCGLNVSGSCSHTFTEQENQTQEKNNEFSSHSRTTQRR